MSEVKTRKSPGLILILGLLTALGPIATDIYLPAFEDIAVKLNTHISTISYTLSSFFIGLSIGQLIYGPMLERFGRKKPIYLGLVIYFLASLGCALSADIYILIGLRFFQAVGACAGMVAARALVRDLFEDKEVAQVFSLLMVVVAVSPIIAPTLGGLITIQLGWRWVFASLSILTLLVFIGSYFKLPHGKPANPQHSLRLKPVLKNYRQVLLDKQFAVYAISGSIAYAGIYSYLSGSPHIYLELFAVSKTEYSIIFAIIAAGLIGSSQINNLILKKKETAQVVPVAQVFQCLLSVALVAISYFEVGGLYLTTVLIFLYMCCLGFIFPNASALSLVRLGHTAGNASAMLGAIQMVMGAIGSALVSYFQARTDLAMYLVMCSVAFLAFALLISGTKSLKSAYHLAEK